MDKSSSLRFVCFRKCISDTQPGAGMDGYVGHCKTDEEARMETEMRNRRWEAEKEKMFREEGRTWRQVPARPYIWAWLLLESPVTSYID